MIFKKFFKKLVYLHVVERNIRNKDKEAPLFSEMALLTEDINTGWYLSSPYFNFFHDNFKNLPEVKFINLDGREYVYTADNTGNYIICNDSTLKGTYNYFPPITDKNKNIIIRILQLPFQYTCHFIFDMLPILFIKSY